MSATVIPLNPHGCAHISAKPSGFRIALRSVRVAVDYERRTPDDTAELAILLRDEGDWTLRFEVGADEVRAIVAVMDHEDVH